MTAHRREPTARSLVITIVALLSLTGISLALSRTDLGPLGWAVAMGIAFLKASIVAVNFMEIPHESGSSHLAIAAGLSLFAMLVALTVADVLTRTIVPLEPPPGNEPRQWG